MTGRERVTCAIEHKTPDRIPIAEDFWEDTLTNWIAEGFPGDVTPGDYFDFDIVTMGVDASPRFEAHIVGEDHEWITLQDRFGYVVKKQKGKSRTMDYLSHPVDNRDTWNTVREMFALIPGENARIDEDAFPFRVDEIPGWDEAKSKFDRLRESGKYILGTAYGPHETVWRLRGFTETLYDFALDPDFIAEIAGVYTDFLIEVLAEGLRTGISFDGFMIIEDIASTRGMLFSPDQWREIYKQQIAKIGAFLRENGIHFWMHSCGNGEAVFSDLIECGLQVINPLEAKSGLDIRDLKDTYGNDLCFYGNFDVIALAGSEETMEHEVRSKIAPFTKGGGLIVHSDHSIPPEVSFTRYKKIVELVRQKSACE